MKYYLILGYETIEKFREFGRIQIFLNGTMLENFTADNEESISSVFHNTIIKKETTLDDTIYNSKQSKNELDTMNATLAVQAVKKYAEKFEKSSKDYENIKLVELSIHRGGDHHELKEHINNLDHINKHQIMMIIAKHIPDVFLQIFNNTYDKKHYLTDNLEPKVQKKYRVYDYQPKKLKILQIDSDAFSNKEINKITISVKGGPSNATNGFTSKRNMIVIFPIFLIPEKMFTYETLNYLYERSKKYFLRKQYQLNSYPFYTSNLGHTPQPNKDGTYTINEKPLQWPGLNYMPVDIRSKECWFLGQPIGNDCNFNLYIHKKHKIYTIHHTPTPPKGRWELNLCLVNMFEQLPKKLG